MTALEDGRLSRLAHRKNAMRRFYALTAASTVVPGLGLLGTRARKVGIGILGLFFVGLLAVLLKFGSQGFVHTALRIGVSRQKLLIVIVGLLVGMVLWCLAIALTARLARPRGASRLEKLTTRLFAALCCTLVIFPSLFFARTLEVQRGLVSAVFSTNTSGGQSAASVDVAAEDPWANTPRVNVLLLGSDAGPDRTGVRPDSIMVASINTKTGDTTLIGVPRSLRHVPFPVTSPLHAIYPNGFDCDVPNDPCWLNKVWSVGVERADLYPGNPDPGLTATREAVSEALGLTITHAVVIDLSGFARLVDAMGGVDIDVKERVCVGCKRPYVNGPIIWGPNGPRYIEPGPQHLDGELALWYARSRALSDDNSRIRRQRCVAGALLKQVNPISMLARYPAIAGAVSTHVKIDIAQDELPAWADLVSRVQRGKINSLALTNDVVPSDNPDFAKVRSLVQEAVSPATLNAPTTPATPSAPVTSSGSSGTPAAGTTPPSGTPTTAPTTGGIASLATAC